MKFILSLFLSGVVFFTSSAQDFSNKGKDFWLAYSYHVGMTNPGGQPVMTLYLTSDVSTTYTVEIFGTATIQTGSIAPNQVVSVVIPNTYFINNEGKFVNKAIHVTAVKPIVVYSYITRSQASAASLCLPSNVLGKEYYAMSYTQLSNEANSNSFFTIVAVEDNTTVEIVPTANTKGGWLAGSTNTITLNKGEVYQVLGTTTGNIGVDISGSRIRSIAAAGGGCKKIAVFSGSGKIAIGCNGSSDNLYQQLYPAASWGKKYLTVPSYNRPNNYYRIVRNNPATNVTLNGVAIPAASFVNNYYEFFNNTPNLIESDLPVSVTQYFTTQGCAGNGTPYDPDMIVLNPVEQNITRVTLISSNLTVAGIHQHNLHIVIKNAGTAISSFLFDNAPIPAGSAWVTHPSDPNFSYLYLANVSETSHTLSSDSGFNALAYGYGNAETYGYSAGTNVKDLYQQIGVKTQYGIETTPSVCTGAPFKFRVSLPYQPLAMDWDFHGLQTDTSVNNPVADSTTFVNSRQIWWYSLPNFYTYPTIGIYPVTITTHTNNADGCGTEQDIDFDLEVSNPPTADFTFQTNGCVTDPVQFKDSSTTVKPTYAWIWNFGDPGSGASNTSSVKNPTHTFSAPGTYTVTYSNITTPGCLSNVVTKQVTVLEAPVAKFGISSPTCRGKTITFSDLSNAPSQGTLVKWFWDFGDGVTQTLTASSNPTHIYSSTGVFNVTLKVESNTGCQSSVFTLPVTVNPNPVVNFSLPQVCLPTGVAQFFDSTTIADGSQSQFTYLWNFGDTPSGSLNTSAIKNPAHNYNTIGPYIINLQVTSKDGCISDTTKVLSSIYSQPKSAFAVNAENCLNDTTYFTDQSNGQGSAITNWYWNFGDGQSSTLQNPTHIYSSAGSYTVSHYIKTDKGCYSDTLTKQVTINLLPTASFATSTPACETKDVSFTNASAANSGILTAWNWNLGDGTVFTKPDDNPFNHIYTSSGSYTATLLVESNKGCKSTVLSKQIIVNAQPQPGFNSPDVCLTDAFAQFTDTSKISSGSITTWLWNFGDPTSGALNTSLLQNPRHKYNAVGIYNVTLTLTSNNGCVASITKPFTVNGAVPKANFTVLNNTGLCSNTDVEIQNTSTVDFGNITKVEIYWDVTNSPSAFDVDANPSPNKIYAHLYPNFQTPLSKTYQVKFRSYSGSICVDEITKSITVNASPSVQFLPISDTCFNISAFAITQASEIGGVPGTGVFSGRGIVNGSNIFDPAVAGVGTHTIRYTFTSNMGCIDYQEQTITIYPIVNVNAGPDRTVLEAATITLEPVITGNALQYLWTPNQYLNDNTIVNPIVTGIQDITYSLSVTGTGGCIFRDDVFVKVLKFPNIPNTFTPNNDGINDAWVIDHLSDYPNVRIQVFNRYGQVVFESKGYGKPWDGTMKGKALPFGTYYYVIEPGNGRKPVTGYVTLIK